MKTYPPVFIICNLFLLLFPYTTLAGDQASASDTSSEEDHQADETAQEVELKPVDETDPWKNFVPPKDKFDWLQLTTGEWLKGELKVFYSQQFEFDSDNLGILNIDKKDVRQFRSSGIKSVGLSGPLILYGLLQLTQDQVIITQNETQRVFNRNDLVSITRGAMTETQKWSANISLGVDFSTGNTEQFNYSATADIRRRTAANRFVLTYLGQISSSQSIETADNHRVKAFDDIFKTRQFYLRPVFAEYFSDTFQNIQGQYTIGSGLGYQLIDTSKTEWNVTGGIAFQETRFNSVAVGQDQTVSTPALVMSTYYETDLTKIVDFNGNYSFKLLNEESGKYTHHIIATFDTQLISWLDFDISLVWDRIQNPTPNADGTVPKQNDYKMLFTLGIEY